MDLPELVSVWAVPLFGPASFYWIVFLEVNYSLKLISVRKVDVRMCGLDGCLRLLALGGFLPVSQLLWGRYLDF